MDPPQRSPREHRRARVYRGLYQWDDSQRAERRERALWRVLELVCEPGSIRYRIVPGALRNAMPDHPERITAGGSGRHPPLAGLGIVGPGAVAIRLRRSVHPGGTFASRRRLTDALEWTDGDGTTDVARLGRLRGISGM